MDAAEASHREAASGLGHESHTRPQVKSRAAGDTRADPRSSAHDTIGAPQLRLAQARSSGVCSF